MGHLVRPYASPMDFDPDNPTAHIPHVGAWMHERGTLRQMTDTLRQLAHDWENHLGKPKTAQKCLEAAEELESGACSVRVGATTYTVTDQPWSTQAHSN